jgi:hypothetical protein
LCRPCPSRWNRPPLRSRSPIEINAHAPPTQTGAVQCADHTLGYIRGNFDDRKRIADVYASHLISLDASLTSNCSDDFARSEAVPLTNTYEQLHERRALCRRF